MCVVEANLEVDFQEIRRNKMQQFHEFENDLKERKDWIIKDLESYFSQNAFMQCTANVESLSFFDDF